MSLTINANVASGEANSYLTIAAASALIEAQPVFFTTWAALTTAQKTAWLVWATRAIDRYPFLGQKYSYAQALEFPRMIDGQLQEARAPIYSATTIAFVAGSPATITDSASGFLTNGFLGDPWEGLIVYGSLNDNDTNNNGSYTLDSVVAGVITLDSSDTLYDEVAGPQITLMGNQPSIPPQVQEAVCEAIRWGKREIGTDDSADDRLLESVSVGGAISVTFAGSLYARLLGGNERAVKDLLRPYLATGLTAKLVRT